MDRFESMALFIEIAERKSLAAVARSRNVAPSTVTLALQRLEERLGARLVTRSTRRLSLTSEGERYLGDCSRILAELAESERAVAGQRRGISGLLRITTTNDFGRARVAPLVHRFLRAHPGVRVELLLSDAVLDLIEERVDLALRFGPLLDSRLMARRLFTSRRVVCAAPSYWKAHPPPRHPKELVEHNCLVLARRGAPQASWPFRDGRGGTFHVQVAGDRTANDGGVLRTWSLDGAGVIFKSAWDAEDDIRAGRLVPVLESFALPSTELHAVHTGGRAPSRRLAVFLDFLEKNLTPPSMSGPTASAPAQRRRPARLPK
ncbi:MAG: LysR family transcriptional regulator [Labilithrix sp.]|nr:LysR family transcriptional regulator [Labilithrix sp.]